MRITDFALINDIKNEYREHREDGLGRESAVEALIFSYQNMLSYGEKDDAILFWIALADAQYSCRELSQIVAARGKESLERLHETNWKIADIDILRRKEHYAAAPMSEQKTIKRAKKYRCCWNVGDTFAYQLSAPEWEPVGLSGAYILLRKVADTEADGYLFPVVSLSVWQKKPFPTTLAEFQQATLLRLARGRNGAPLSKYEYRAQIIFTRGTQLSGIPLEYIGRFENYPMPEDEVVFLESGEACMISPSKLEHEIFMFWKVDQYFRQN